MALAWHGDSMILARARMPACGDSLRALLFLERTLEAADWRPPHMPSDAVLLVRRLAVPLVEPAAAPLSLSVRFARALRACAARARRPWCEDDAATADAVLFASEAELVACLARDWLRGLLADRWWWRQVLAGESPARWIERRFQSRPELVVAVVGLLANTGDAVAWVAQLGEAAARETLAAIERAHGVQSRAVEGEPVDDVAQIAARAPASPGPRASEITATARRIRYIAAEAFMPSLTPSQRRVLALALTLERSPALARSQTFPIALRAAERVMAEAQSMLPSGNVMLVRQTERRAGASTPKANRLDLTRSRRQTRAAVSNAAVAAGRSDPRKPSGSSRRKVRSTAHDQRFAPIATAPSAVPAAALSTERADISQERLREEPDPAPPRSAPTPSRTSDAAADPRSETQARAIEAPLASRAPRVRTAFGGLFYLLNAALAMEIYGDFTAPLAKNLELSPWDWLALVGREWFGDEIRDDAAWRVLADLAGRLPEEEPDRDFHPPSPTWLAEHLASLRARIALAIDAEHEEDVAARVCRYPAQIEVSATAVHVHLALRDLPLAIRIAGLDRDPGWIPAAGRAVYFHFD